MSTPARIYLAGPTVFFRDAEAVFTELEHQCLAHGLAPVRPADPTGEDGASLSGPAAARHLFQHNTQRIRQAQCVLADLRPFRGPLEPDSGTVFEVGFAHALGLPVAAVIPEDSPWADRIRQHCGTGPDNHWGGQMDGTFDQLIEDFGGPLNLMLSESCAVFTAVPEAMAWLAQSTKGVDGGASGQDFPVHMPLPEPSGQELKAARIAAGLTQNQAAELLGYPLQLGSRGGLQSRTWQALENPNDPRNMSGPTFALFRLLTGQHPDFQLSVRQARGHQPGRGDPN